MKAQCDRDRMWFVSSVDLRKLQMYGGHMQLGGVDVLVGFRLSIVRRAAAMLVLHFGDIRAHSSGKGTVGAYALHVQCPWRFDGPVETITGHDDLWKYAGPGEQPLDCSYEDGLSVQDERLNNFLGPQDVSTGSWVNETDRLVVAAAQQTSRGDLRLELTGGHAILLFPPSSNLDPCPFFAPRNPPPLL